MTTHRTPLMDISNNDMTSSPAAEGNRRKSGRAVKAPEKFVPDVSSSQAGAKRKRSGGQDDENDASENEEEDLEESENTGESEVEEEVVKPKKKAKSAPKPVRRSAAKKAKINGTASHEDAPSVKLPNRPKATSKKVAIADKDAEGLYAEVYNTGLSSEDVAMLWLQRYNEGAELAMVDLVNFILKSAGCNLLVTVDDINDPENIEGRLGDLQEEYQAQNISDYPLISKAKSSHAFRTNLMSFFEHLIQAMHAKTVLYTQPELIENIHMWTATMSSSTARPFRHTATVIALATTTALCIVTKKVVDLAAKSLRQLENLKKGKGGSKAIRAEFQKKVTEAESNKEFLENIIKDYFETVYVHRYRDVDARIRTECAAALGDWILTLPSIFMESSYLRYMGWTLSDTHAPMRQEVIKQLGRIMADPHNVGTMRHFIERFRPRMIEIATQDADPAVRASAVELMDLVRQAGMLEPDDIDVIGKLIFASEPKVRKAVVGFFAESIRETHDAMIEELGGEEILEGTLSVEDEEDFESPRATWLKLKTLAELLLSYDAEDGQELPSQVDAAEFLDVFGSESRFTLAAQSLYDKVPELQEWEMIAGYLLFDHSADPAGNEAERSLKAAFKPEEKEELVLLEILNAMVKTHLTHLTDSDRPKEKGKRKSAHLEASEARETTARRLAVLIPRLLKKYGANPTTAKVVLRLEHVLNLGVFQDLRQDSTTYAKLVDEISTQFNSHADKAVLAEAGAALLHARGYDELEEITESKIQSLWEDATGMLRKISRAGEIAVRGAFKNKLLVDLSHNLARIEELSSISNCVEIMEATTEKNGKSLIDILLDVVNRGVFEDSDDEALDVLEDQVALSAIRSSMFYFMWKTRALMESVTANQDISEVDVDQLRQRQNTFATNLTAAVSSRASLDTVRLVGSGILLDLFVLFTSLRAAEPKPKAGSAGAEPRHYSHLTSLSKEVHPEVQAELTSIFEALEKKYAKHSKKKLAEPGEDEEPEGLDSDDEEDEDAEPTDVERQSETLKAEQQLCELTGKLVLAILARVIDVSSPAKGKLRARIQRNRTRLGHNFKDVVAYLDEPKVKGKKSHKSKAQQAAAAGKKAAKSAEIVIEDEEEEEEEDDPFAEEEPEEGTVEDLRRRELLDEEPPASIADGDEEDAVGEQDDDDMLGD